MSAGKAGLGKEESAGKTEPGNEENTGKVGLRKKSGQFQRTARSVKSGVVRRRSARFPGVMEPALS